MKSKIEKLPKSEVRLEITVETQDLKEAKEKALKNLAPNVKIPGFRPGKAPLAMVESRVGEKAILQETLEVLISDVYTKALKEHRFFPLASPKVEFPALDKLKSLDNKLAAAKQVYSLTKEGLKIVYTVPVAPEIKLGDYKKALSEIRGGKRIETAKTLSEAGEKAREEKETQQKRAEKLGKQTPKEQDEELEEKILETLLDCSEFEIPEVLVEHEINEHLIPQARAKIERLGQTLESALKLQRNKSLEDYKKELRPVAEKIIKLRLIINEVARREKLPLEKTGDLGYIITWLKRLVTGK